MPTLFEIGDELNHVLSLIRDDGEVDGPLEEWLAKVGEREAEKFDRCVGLIRLLETDAAKFKAEAAAFEAEAKRWEEKAKSRETRVGDLRDRLRDHLVRTGRTKAETASGRALRVQVNGAAKLAVDPGAKVPAEFCTLEPDRDKIRKALAAGRELAFARLLPRGCHLRIG